MDLEQYLARIGHRGAINIDRSTLDGLMHAHINAVTFENLNQQMGLPVTMDIADIFAKVVGQRRVAGALS